MARPRTVALEKLLDAAEVIVTRSGASALSFGNVATEANISKATVQSAFGTRAALIDALIGRWMVQEKERYDLALGEKATPEAHLNAHLQSTVADMLDNNGQRVSTLVAFLTGDGVESESMRQWYQDRLGELKATTHEERKRRVIYLASEGAFFLRCMAGLPIDDATWRDVFSDLSQLSETSTDDTLGALS